MSKGTALAKRNADGLAIIGRTLYDLRGIRFDDGEEGNEPPDASVIQAKLDAVIAEHALCADVIAGKDAEITAVKAANYDLLMAVPVDEDTSTDAGEPDEDTDIDIDDLFGE